MKGEYCHHTKVSQGIYRAEAGIYVATAKGLEFLYDEAKTPLGGYRSRVCVHADNNSPLHEMLITLNKNTYIPPHKHINKSESLHVIMGEAICLLFNEVGTVTASYRLGAFAEDKVFYVRVEDAVYHTIYPLTELFVFHEVTTGPYRQEDTIIAPWSPCKLDVELGKDFLRKLI